ncbi:MAG: pyruvate:ferredoxin (flavodoxin) oxidoreductase, partial [Candidatus Methanofastidiosa archaeon]|nr:pyruvate:ferredoxin (flavodoxin) oxidoreductase [Candidatus Methanofastidiosa archaeon]
FRTSHEIQKIEVMEFEDLEKLLDYDALNEFRQRGLNPENPVTRGTAQNPDIYFQAAEASNPFYLKVPDVVNDYMKEINKITGREYKPFNYYGDPEAENIIIAMGSVTDTIEETIDYLLEKGEKVGVIKVHLYRPFSAKYFFDVLPTTVKKISVLDRTKEKGALGEPLYLDVRSLFYGKAEQPLIVGGRYGLGSKDTTPSQILAVYNNLKADQPKDGFTLGIVDDVTNLSLEIGEKIQTAPEGTIQCKFWGFGSDGTVGANKSAIKIIGDDTDMYAQGYFAYDSKKSGGITISHLRFGHTPIKSTYLISDADFVSCSKQSYVNSYDLLRGLKKGGTFLLNCIWDETELEANLPASMKRYIAENDIKFYTINATKLAVDIGLGARINMIMQSAFFKLSEVLPINEAVAHLKKSVVKDYGSKGEKIVNMNYEAIDKGLNALVKIDVPESWKDAQDEEAVVLEVPEFIEEVVFPMIRQEGDDFPVSTFVGREDGTLPAGTAAYEKRAIAVDAPHWIKENCIQCNQCSYVCPHAVIRPILVTEEEKANAPEAFETIKPIGRGFDGLEYRMQVSILDCTGCGNCADICPAKDKALVMTPFEEEFELESPNWDFAMTVKNKGDLFEPTTLKNSQFQQPLFEFSGACAGCGETPYAKLVTQLFGDRMIVANATGCSSIWGASAPATPYCVNQEGQGPAWANSLFEDNAEFGYGMSVATRQIREKIKFAMEEFLTLNIDTELNEYFKQWLEGMGNAKATKAAAGMILPRLDTKFDND